MIDFSEQLPSLKKMKEELKGMKALCLFAPKKVKKDLKKIEEEFNDLLTQTNKFHKYFSDKGWILHDSLNMNTIKLANQMHEDKGVIDGEKVLIDYYLNINKLYINRLKSQPEFLQRFHLIQLALDDHFNKRYHASVPVLLIIIDGAVNDYTKRKGFFAKGIDISVWDCLVGGVEGLEKIKSIFNQSRKRTNNEKIEMPYRNGILHGRDLNYNNAQVSCKCISLLFAICDWMNNKKTEEERKDKYIKESTPPSFKDIYKTIKKNKSDKQKINQWKSKVLVVNEDLPECGDLKDYDEYRFIHPIINMCRYWREKNYGSLSVILKNMYSHEQNHKIRPKLCREDFCEKQFKSFKILEVEDRAISLKRILVEVTWCYKDNIITANLEFGSIYQDKNGKGLIAEEDDGEWILMPWNITGLYK